MELKTKTFQVPLQQGFLDCLFEKPPAGYCNGTAVVMTGIKSHKLKDSYTDIAHLCHENGYQTIRFDFRGHGDSYDSPNWEKYGVLDQLDDITELLIYLRKNGLIENKLVLIPMSFSAEATLLYIARNNDVAFSILISPGIGKSFSSGNVNKYRREWWDKAIKTTQIPFNQYKKELSNIRIPIYALHGDLDPTVPIEQSEELKELIGSTLTLYAIEGGGHKYTEPKEGQLKRQEIFNSILESQKTL